MSFSYKHFAKLDSTNAYLQQKQSETDIRGWVVSADEQTAGKGMGNNSWESEAGKNLTFSLALDMSFLPAERQFLLSEAVALGLLEALEAELTDGMSFQDTVFCAEILGQDHPSMSYRAQRASVSMDGKSSVSMPSRLQIKWPNDIYFDNRKLAGILINSTIKAGKMDVSIIGIGLNVNQMQFQDWPTHPISMKMVTGKNYDLQPLLVQIVDHLLLKVKQLRADPTSIEYDYLKRLFRYRTWADYEVDGKVLRLFMTGIDWFGRLQLIDEQQILQTFEIKEIRFVT